jgi:uncharacterized protein Usg
VIEPDFGKMFFKGYSVVTVNVIYYMPDQKHLINEFMWQTLDLRPKYPRIKKFLNFWEREIEADIKEIQLSDSLAVSPRRFRRVDEIFGILH